MIWKTRALQAALVTGLAGASTIAITSSAFAEPVALRDRNGSRIALQPYASNIVRSTIALDPALASAAPGERPNAKSDATGWTHQTDTSGNVFTSSALIPYIYSLGYQTYETGALHARAIHGLPERSQSGGYRRPIYVRPRLPRRVCDATGTYQAPVYLPAGTAWYDY